MFGNFCNKSFNKKIDCTALVTNKANVELSVLIEEEHFLLKKRTENLFEGNHRSQCLQSSSLMEVSCESMTLTVNYTHK